jgi:uncharacterized protein (DUF488 family)
MNLPKEIWTVGHSRRSLEEFLGLLKAFDITAVADVRRFPVSSRFPHFSQMQLFKTLSKLDVAYTPFPELGGRRRPQPDSPNTLWRNEAFRGYADYMETKPFHDGIERLLKIAEEQRTAILCAEAIWWRCHRALIADYLKAMGIQVTHIFNAERSQEHPYTSAARVVDGKVTYVPEGTLELALR